MPATPESQRPAYAEQNVVVAFVGTDGSYFVGRQTDEQAADSVTYLQQFEHTVLMSIDWSDNPAMAEIVADDLRSTYADNYRAEGPYKI